MNKEKIEKLQNMERLSLRNLGSLHEEAQEIHNRQVAEERKLSAIQVMSIFVKKDLPFETAPQITRGIQVLIDEGIPFHFCQKLGREILLLSEQV